MKLSSSLVVLAFGLSSFTEAATAPNILALRRLMTDQRFIGLVSPCTTGGTTRTTAAEWLRTAFHDAGSFDASTGTGGIDASLVYELGYDENKGAFASATHNQFRLSQEAGVTMADMTVLGAIMAVAACGGPIIPFYAGRLDAGAPVQPGFLPLPEQSHATHLSQFQRMGFTNTEMISLVACGHTIGGAHVANTPSVTTAAFAAFDGTRAVFDNRVATEYKAGTLTNPLGKPIDLSNPATSSDTRIFSSDNNATMYSYADSQSLFFSDCSTVLGKMFNQLVPAGTQLTTTALTPLPVSLGFRISLRNGAFHVQIGTARVYNMVGQWSSYDVIYRTRDGAIGTDSNLLFVRAVTTLNNGATVQLKIVTTRSPGVDPLTGISSMSVVLKLNDGTTYSSPEGTETVAIEDRIAIETYETFTCMYTAADGNKGIIITIQVLQTGPTYQEDKVYIDYELASDLTRQSFGTTIEASYSRPRTGTGFNYYTVYVPNVKAIDFGNYAARVVRADGSVQRDTRQGIFFWQSNVDTCPTGTTPPEPTTTVISRVPVSTFVSTETRYIATEVVTPSSRIATVTNSVDGPLETRRSTLVIPASTETSFFDSTTVPPASTVVSTFVPEPTITTESSLTTSTPTQVVTTTTTSTEFVECTPGTRFRRGGRFDRRAQVTVTESSGTVTQTQFVDGTEISTAPTPVSTVTETESGPLTIVSETETSREPVSTFVSTRYFEGETPLETSTSSLEPATSTITAISTVEAATVTSTSTVTVVETACSRDPITTTIKVYDDVTTTPPVAETTQTIVNGDTTKLVTAKSTFIPDPSKILTTVTPRTTTVYTTKTSVINPARSTVTRTTHSTKKQTYFTTVKVNPPRVIKTVTRTSTTGTTKCTNQHIRFPKACCPTAAISLTPSPTSAQRVRRAVEPDASTTITETRFFEAPTPLTTILTTVDGATATSTILSVTTARTATIRSTITAATPRRTITRTVRSTAARQTTTKLVSGSTITQRVTQTRTSTLKAVTTTKTQTVKVAAKCAHNRTIGSLYASTCPKAGLAGWAGRNAQVASITSLKKLAPTQTVTVSCGTGGNFLY